MKRIEYIEIEQMTEHSNKLELCRQTGSLEVFQMQLINEFYVDVRGWSLTNIHKMANVTNTSLDVEREILICAEVYRQ